MIARLFSRVPVLALIAASVVATVVALPARACYPTYYNTGYYRPSYYPTSYYPTTSYCAPTYTPTYYNYPAVGVVQTPYVPVTEVRYQTVTQVPVTSSVTTYSNGVTQPVITQPTTQVQAQAPNTSIQDLATLLKLMQQYQQPAQQYQQEPVTEVAPPRVAPRRKVEESSYLPTAEAEETIQVASVPQVAVERVRIVRPRQTFAAVNDCACDTPAVGLSSGYGVVGIPRVNACGVTALRPTLGLGYGSGLVGVPRVGACAGVIGIPRVGACAGTVAFRPTTLGLGIGSNVAFAPRARIVFRVR